MKIVYTCLAIFFLSLTAVTASAQKVTRGPYMQSPGPYSIIIHWRTDSLTSSQVNYGPSQSSVPFSVTEPTLVTEHRIKLTGLSSKTKYYYSIGAIGQTMVGPESRMYFTTAPDSTNTTTNRFWVIGDFGHGNDAERKVRNSYLSYCANHPADLQLWVGDNAYQDGTDQEFTDKVFDTVNCFGNVFRNLPFASASGNHDYNSICPWQPALCTIDPNLHTGPYLDMIDPPTQGELGGVPSNHKMYYSFDYGDVHFVVLCSELGSATPAYNWIGLFNTSDTFTSPMTEWLKADLASTNKKWKIAIWHQCPYSGQNDFTDNILQPFCVAMRTHFNPILEHYGVDMVVTGHDHNFQRSFLINGHYGYKNTFTPDMMINGGSGMEDLGEPYIKHTDGPDAGKGTVYVVAGNSSEGNDYSPIDHPAISYGEACDTCFGSFIFDVTGDRLDAKYLTHYGAVLDHFTIIKRSTTAVPEVKPVVDNVYVYPNPFHGQTSLGYTLRKRGNVKVDIMDLTGKIVYSISKEMREAGSYTDLLDLETPVIPEGAYFIRLECDGMVKYKKVVDLDKGR